MLRDPANNFILFLFLCTGKERDEESC
jgi:hypothetical protein